VETGIAIDPATLGFINAVELLVGAALKPRTVRCRVRRGALVIELDEATLGALPDGEADRLRADIARLSPPATARSPIRFAPYRTGSAFVGAPAGGADG
jgi:uncharacterized protein